MPLDLLVAAVAPRCSYTAAMYSHSLKWKSDSLKTREQHQALNKARAALCPNSFAWTRDFAITEHRSEMKAMWNQRHHKDSESVQVSETRQEGSDPLQPIAMRTAISWRTDPTASRPTKSYSAVLALPTIFAPSYGASVAEVGEWPCKEDMDYEGDARVRTEKIHARMMPTPRVKGNDTVAWAHRNFVEPFPLDDFRPDFNEISIFLRNYHVAELEFSDEDGIGALGEHMMKLLDPIDCL